MQAVDGARSGIGKLHILRDISERVVQLRPHYVLREKKLFFMLSRRPALELSPDEFLLYQSIDGRKKVGELEAQHPGTIHRLLRWHEDQIVELLPVAAPTTGPHLLLIEPHMDDAVLSIGGSLLHRRGKNRLTILSVVKWSNFTSYLMLKRNYTDVAEITSIRLQESALAARILQAEHQCLDWTDAPLRLCPAQKWDRSIVEKHSVYPTRFAHLCPNPQEVSTMATRLMDVVNTLAPDELWIPMGVGNHLDHRTTRSACLLMLARAGERFSNTRIVMYEDLPYADDIAHSSDIRDALAECGARLIRCAEDVTDVFTEKLRLVSIYASQFKLTYMEPKIRASAERESGAIGRQAEAYHVLEGTYRVPRESRLAQNRSSLTALHEKTASLLRKNRKYRQFTVIALPSGHLGELRLNAEILSAAFPSANIRFLVAQQIIWQVPETASQSMAFKLVEGRLFAWMSAIARELLQFTTPIVVLWWGADAVPGFVKMVTKLCFPLRRVLFAQTLSDFCCVLSEQLGMV